ncbi:MAG TPA: hypothetical protein VGB43_08315 [Flavobacterium sp.]|jgi:gas vesicle protein
MKNKNLLVGIAAGAAILSVVMLLRRNKYSVRSLYNSAEQTIDGMKSRITGSDQSTDDYQMDSAGRHLANKARHKAEHHLAMSRNGH